MTTANLNVRIDRGVKAELEELATAIGMTSSAVVNVLVKRFVMERGFPFDVKVPAYYDFGSEREAEDLMDELSMEALADEG